MKLRLALIAILLMPLMTWAQTITPIQQIQGWVGQFLPDSCNDGPNPAFVGAPVKVKGVVITRGGLNATSGQTRWIWIRDVTATSPSTPYANITIRSSGGTVPTDINTLIEGDTIEVIGSIEEFIGANGNGETQLTPTSVQLVSEESGPAPLPILINVGELNGALNANNQPTNNLITGEKYEGNFVEFQNVQVVERLINGDRCQFLVKDGNNNHIWVWDRFKTQRISEGFVPPNIGDSYTSIKGMIEGWKNGCPGSATTNRGYNLNPFSLTHYVKGASSPAVGSIKKSTPCPNSTNPVTISASVTDDGTVQSVEVLYSITGTGAYTAVPATAVGTRYSANIPAQPNGTIVRFYLRAKDNVNNTSVQPNVPANISPLFYTINNSGCTVKDIQFTPYTNGRSGYARDNAVGFLGDTVTVQGIVTASPAATNLGYLFIQQPTDTAWAGIWVNGGSLISGFNIGELVSITGSVEELSGLTRISNVSNAFLIATGQTLPAPIVLNPALFTTYSFANNEKYEGMLVKLENPVVGQDLFVVDPNADAFRNQNNGEYRIGSDINDPNTGCRILAGRQGSAVFSSLNVSYINSLRWDTVDGELNVEVKLVEPGQVVSFIQGVMTYSFGNMKLLPRNNSDISIVVSNKDLLNEKQFQLYPNPASQKVNLVFEKVLSSSNLEIYNNQGQLVIQSEVNGNQVDLNVNKLTNGIYRLRITDSKGKVSAIRNLLISK